MSNATPGMEIPADDPTAVELVLAVRGGNVDTLRRLLAEDPALARAGLVGVVPDYSKQTALQVAGAADTRRQILVDWLTERGAAQG